MLHININGREIKAYEGWTILRAASENGIEIPTLCHDERVKPYGACGICVVEAENSPKLLRACSTLASDGMIIKTDTERVKASRRAALELLLSDHTGDCRPPCAAACPANTDCQGYAGLIANGEYEEALKLTMEKIPLPASIGRVCPHPCEDACRRKLVEEPVNLARLKSFAADMGAEKGVKYIPSIKPDTGKNVAIIGGGPGGLSAAYFLRLEGHNVHIYDSMDKMGGMLRYGIPEYRLPKAVLDREIDVIREMGVRMTNDVRIGRDMSFAYLREKYDAVVVAIGAWSFMKLRCPGEDFTGVIGAIDFLRDIALSNPLYTGKRVAVVGGSNTAMDACRTAVRLGATEVYCIYRRTRAEMPAEDIEITEAAEEGVVFKYLTNPIEIVGTDGRVSKIRLQKMELGQPDASGRRAPVPIPGAEETIEVDNVILAIGQSADASGFEELNFSRWKTIVTDENTFETNLPGVFAIGDATNNGASIAVEAIGEAQKAAVVINNYLNNKFMYSNGKLGLIPYEAPYLVHTEKAEKDFADRPKQPREKMKHLTPLDRKVNFNEVAPGYTETQARAEAARCLECGCQDYFECKLIRYADKYKVKPEKYAGDKHVAEPDSSNPFIHRNMEKCILCGLCVRVCDEVMGRSALGFVDRGFDTVIKPELGLPLAESDCISCGQCVSVCPTGAIYENLPVKKPVPVEEDKKHSVCAFCSVGCRTMTASRGGMLTRIMPDDTSDKEAMLCAKGRFGFAAQPKRLVKPMIRKNGSLTPVSYEEALMYITKKMQGISASYGVSAAAVSVSDKLTNEEMGSIGEYAKNVLKTDNIYSFGMVRSGLKEVLGRDASTVTFEEMENTDVIVLLCDNIIKSHTIAGIRIKKAVERGAKLILMSRVYSQADEWAEIKITPSAGLDTLKQFAAALTDMGTAAGTEMNRYLSGVTPQAPIIKAAEMYRKANKAVFVFDQNAVTSDAAILIGDIALMSGHIGKPRSGVIQLKQNNNSQGLSDISAGDGETLMRMIRTKTVKGLIVFGEDVPNVDMSGLEFLAVMDTYLSETAEKADVVLPAAAFWEVGGTYTNTVGITQTINAATEPVIGRTNMQTLRQLAQTSGAPLAKPTCPAAPDITEPCICIPTGNRLYMEKNNTNGLFSRFTNMYDL